MPRTASCCSGVNGPHVGHGGLPEGEVQEAARGVSRQVLGPHARRAVHTHVFFPYEPTMSDVVLEITTEPIDFEIITPTPFGVTRLPILAGLQNL